MFELRKSNCPADNQVTISDCPSKFLVVRTWNILNTRTKVSFDCRFIVARKTTAFSIFGCPATSGHLFACPGRTDNKNFVAYKYILLQFVQLYVNNSVKI